MTLPLVCIGRYKFLYIQHCFLWPKPRTMFADGAVIARADWQVTSFPRLRFNVCAFCVLLFFHLLCKDVQGSHGLLWV